jgi:hypothetical protein
VCGDKAQSKCGKCQIRSYCSRKCQVADWKSHGNDCRTPVQLKQIFDSFIKKCNGSIMQLAQYHGSNIIITVSETLVNFIPCSFHIAHISCNGVHGDNGAHNAMSSLTVTILLADYKYTTTLPYVHLDNISDPGTEWAVYIDASLPSHV